MTTPGQRPHKLHPHPHGHPHDKPHDEPAVDPDEPPVDPKPPVVDPDAPAHVDPAEPDPMTTGQPADPGHGADRDEP